MENLQCDDVVEEEYDGPLEIINGEIVGKPDFEIIDGEKFIMSSQDLIHATIRANIGYIFAKYIDDKNIKARAFFSRTDVFLSEDNHLMPDCMVICDLKLLENGKFVDGAPDLIVEVLSGSTMRNDLGKKKAAYERNGVKEYWIVDPWSKRIEVYHLIDGKFELDEVYKYHTEEEFAELDEEDKKTVKNYIKVSIFEDLQVDIRKVFKWWFDD